MFFVNILTIFVIILLAFWLFTVILTPLYFKWGIGKWFLHDIFGWCTPDDTPGFDGCSFESRCKHCHKKILMDSQGNWFPIE